MMGTADAQPEMFHAVQLEDLVPPEHPLRKIHPLMETARIRQFCAPFYCPDNGRPSSCSWPWSAATSWASARIGS